MSRRVYSLRLHAYKVLCAGGSLQQSSLGDQCLNRLASGNMSLSRMAPCLYLNPHLFLIHLVWQGKFVKKVAKVKAIFDKMSVEVTIKTIFKEMLFHCRWLFFGVRCYLYAWHLNVILTSL